MSPEEVAAFISEYGLSDMFLYANLLTSNDPEVALNDNTPVPTFATVLTNAAAAAEVADLDVAAIDAGVQTNHPQPAVQEEPLPTKTDLASGSKKSHKKRPRSAQLIAAEKKRKEKMNQKKKKKAAEKLQKRKPIVNVKVKSDQSGESSNQNDANEPKQVMLDIAGSGSGYQNHDYNSYMQLMSDQIGGFGTNNYEQIHDFNQMAIPAPSTYFPFDQPNTGNLGLVNCNGNGNMYYDHQQPYYPVMPPPDQLDVISEPMMMPSYMPLNQVPMALLNSLFPCSELLFTPPASPTPQAPPPPPPSQFPGDKSDV